MNCPSSRPRPYGAWATQDHPSRNLLLRSHGLSTLLSCCGRDNHLESIFVTASDAWSSRGCTTSERAPQTWYCVLSWGHFLPLVLHPPVPLVPTQLMSKRIYLPRDITKGDNEERAYRKRHCVFALCPPGLIPRRTRSYAPILVTRTQRASVKSVTTSSDPPPTSLNWLQTLVQIGESGTHGAQSHLAKPC